VVAIAPPVAFLLAVTLSSRLAGYERIVFYEKALAAIVSASLVARLAGAPLRGAIDAVTLGVGAFLAFGRMGCLRVGCCHGRPSRWGIRYGHDHVAAGFEARLRDVTVLPVQLADGAVSAAMTALGIAIAWRGAPGHAAAAWFAGYGVSRFALELLRGDDRPYGLGLSEAQWTAVATSALAIALWPHAAVIACAALVAAGALALIVARRRAWPPAYWLANPNHLRELDAHLIARAAAPADAPATTTLGLQLSVHALDAATFDVIVSWAGARRPLDARTMRRVAAQLGARWTVVDVVAGRTPGLIHLIVARA
jgi:hypothetical protein